MNISCNEQTFYAFYCHMSVFLSALICFIHVGFIHGVYFEWDRNPLLSVHFFGAQQCLDCRVYIWATKTNHTNRVGVNQIKAAKCKHKVCLSVKIWRKKQMKFPTKIKKNPMFQYFAVLCGSNDRMLSSCNALWTGGLCPRGNVLPPVLCFSHLQSDWAKQKYLSIMSMRRLGLGFAGGDINETPGLSPWTVDYLYDWPRRKPPPETTGKATNVLSTFIELKTPP